MAELVTSLSQMRGLLEALGVGELGQGLWIWHPVASAWASGSSLTRDLLPCLCAWLGFGEASGLFPVVLCPGRASVEHHRGSGEAWGKSEGGKEE